MYIKLFSILILLTVGTSCIDRNQIDVTKIPQANSILKKIPTGLKFGETIYKSYVPIYSDLLLAHEKNHVALQGYVSIRNTNFTKPLYIEKITYYNTNGKFIREYLDQPIYLKPFSSYNITVKTNDLDGGSGAKFLVFYKLANNIPQHPLIEALFTGTFGTKAISFSSRAILLKKSTELVRWYHFWVKIVIK